MEGTNELRLCEAEMIVALQIYVDYIMPNAQAKVKSVDKNDNSFIVKLIKE